MKTNYINFNNNKPTRVFYWLLIALIASFFGMGCKKFVQIPAPTTQLVSSSVFNNVGSATSALTYIYSQMWITPTGGMSQYISQNVGLQADELKNWSTQIAQVRFYTNALSSNYDDGQWAQYYNYIYKANAVIEGLQQYNGVSPAAKQQLIGEAKFIRAFFHFYLTNMYGAVPLALSTDYATNNTISRTPRVQVLQQIIADLSAAQAALNVNYVDLSDTTATTERVRPNKAAATALLARAWLYLGDYDNQNQNDYQKADSAASAVIANTKYKPSPISGSGSVFTKNSTEAIWQIQTPGGGGINSLTDTFDGFYFILTSAPGTGSTSCTTISSTLMSAFEPNDLRKTNWIGSYTSTSAPVTTYYFPYKYKNRSLLSTEYIMVLRLAEQFLIRAEARAQTNNISGAISDLNQIRTRAGLPDYAGTTDKPSVLAAILHERQVELFVEWGHRWFDLNRTGNANTVMGIATPQKGGTWNVNGFQQLYPVPQTEDLINPNLGQNTGY